MSSNAAPEHTSALEQEIRRLYKSCYGAEKSFRALAAFGVLFSSSAKVSFARFGMAVNCKGFGLG